jgi:hypothetical protein
MARERTVECDQPHALDLTLGKQQPVERVSGRWEFVQTLDCMVMINTEQAEL